MANFSTELVKLSLITFGALAIVLGVDAQFELLLDDVGIVMTHTGSVVNISGLVTAITVRGTRPRENESIAATFAVSESNLTTARLHVLMFTRDPDVLFCSIGVVTPGPAADVYSGDSVFNPDPYDWRAPCRPARIPFRENNASCALVLTAAGDLQLLDPLADEILWRSNTTGVGKANLTVDDFGSLSLHEMDDGTTRWQSRVDNADGYGSKCSLFLDGDSGKPSSSAFNTGRVHVGCLFLPFFTSAATLLLSYL